VERDHELERPAAAAVILEAAALLFDLDGVLVDSRAAVEAVWRRWAAERSLDPTPFIAVAHGRRSSETIRAVAPHLDARREAAALDALEAVKTDGVEPAAGAAELVAALPAGRWAIVTSGSRDVAALRLRHTGVRRPAVLVTGQDVPRGKPDPAGYLIAAERLGVDPRACVAIEDAPAGLAAARASGARVIALTTTHPAAALGAADAVVDALTRLRVAPTPAGVLQVTIAPAPSLPD
jgi:sugar-phosphatase